jgi:hypothetical protein
MGVNHGLLILREDHRLNGCRNRVMGRVFGQNRDEIMGDERKFRNKGLHNLYSSPNVTKVRG